jgi:hypothetical protein
MNSTRLRSTPSERFSQDQRSESLKEKADGDSDTKQAEESAPHQPTEQTLVTFTPDEQYAFVTLNFVID